jgi:hypothetical protein
MEYYEIIKKLIGPCAPVGETNEDKRRLEALRETICLVDLLVADIKEAASSKNRREDSMKKIGKEAQEFLDELRESLEELN